MKKALAISAAIVVCLAVLAAGGAGQEDEKKPSFWMKKKLEYAQNILSALATEDFDAISRNAKAMKGLSQIEKWVRAGTPEYKTQLQVFRFANDELIHQADAENIDGAALAYVQLTLNCVNCHRLIRDKPK